MANVTLAQAKAHLRIDHADEDVLLADLIDAAEDNVAQILGRTLPWLDDDDVEVPLPASVRHAVLLILGDLYANREGSFVGDSHAANPAVQSLLSPYRVMGV